MESNSKSAAQLQVGLRLGTERASDIVAWADRQIDRSDEPSMKLIDLAMMGAAKPLDVYSALGNLAGSYDLFEVLPSVLGEAHSLLSEDPSFGPKLARSLYSLFIECNNEIPAAFSEIASFDDEYAVAEQGVYGTEEQVLEGLLAFTSQFRSSA